ncbi:hypothetical protein EGI22_22955 [Lacihabitans sp. LS3-19]|uniref:FG-GAP repeat protein n=1 Tax=Lacihabitans sp. LS3-19 TaxID=2487335 RepID=UPI0020CCE483|nr:FG-GAP repeat protein [Lacihabitans sp. LS3-19]MCP9770774.1 hypothetical protein [Lacihabitans sp. LS3-19]
MKKLFIIILLFPFLTLAQSVTIDPSSSTSGILEVKSNSKGVIPARMSSAERRDIPNPAEGMIVYDTTQKAMYVYSGNQYKKLIAEEESIVIDGIKDGPIASNNQYVIIGDPTFNYNTGRSTLLKLNSSNEWVIEAYLQATDAAAGARFGSAVDIAGNRIAVGASSAGGKGAVYIFEILNGTWVQRSKLTASNGVAGDYFGSSLDLENSGVAIGAPGVVSAPLNITGRVYYFSRTTIQGNSIWFQSIIEAPNPNIDKNFGAKVVMKDVNLYIGAPESYAGRGITYLFERVNGIFTGTHLFYDSDNNPNGKIGRALAISDSLVVIGLSNVNYNEVEGYTFVYSKSGNTTIILNPEIQGGFFPKALSAYRSNILALHGKNIYQNDLFLVSNEEQKNTYIRKINANTFGHYSVTENFTINNKFIFYFLSDLISSEKLFYTKY